MLNVPKERLLEKLGPHCLEALKTSTELCMERGNYEVTVSHYLLALSEQPSNDVARIYSHLDKDIRTLQAKARRSIEQSKRGTTDLPQFSPMLLELFQDALTLSSAHFGGDQIRSGSILAALAQNSERYCHFYVVSEFEGMDEQALITGFDDLCKGSLEGNGKEEAKPSGAAEVIRESALEKFGRNITVEARNGHIDPVFCRENEIAMMTDVLCRRRKNNPILVGEPGVGKTAVAEGLALRINDGSVPAALQGAVLWELDLGALQAGASVKGEFERRLKAVLDEVLNASEKVILFIDEAHTLIGGGGDAGGADAANLLKPALARGQLRAIAATTWSEYKKYFEKDPALTRRFQLIKLNEPTPEQAVTMLRGLRSMYEDEHGVYISDAALHAAAHLSARYLTGRQLPDKALDVLDTACVRVAGGQVSPPLEMERLDQRIMMAERAADDQARDAYLQADPSGNTLSPSDLSKLKKTKTALYTRWQAERRRVDEIGVLRERLKELSKAKDVGDEVAELQQNILSRIMDLRTDRGNEKALVNYEVGESVVAEVIADWTGVPAAAMSDDDASRILDLGDNLRSVVHGQDQALEIIHNQLKSSRLDFVRQNVPRGVFLLVGPSGVGKTETAEQVAQLLFGGRQFLTVVNMSEFQEKHTLSRLIGSPPGYVGYGEGGVLSEAIRRMPYSVVLLDEVEKAHPDIMNLFYQAFDKGLINDGEGREIDCKNIVFFMTSNLGSEAIMQNADTVSNASMEALEKALRPHLEDHFKPALLARMRILCFKPLDEQTISSIISLKLTSLASRLKKARNLTLTWDKSVNTHIAGLCTHSENGARMVEQILDRWILPPIADETLARMTTESPFAEVKVLARDGGFELTFLPDVPEPTKDTIG